MLHISQKSFRNPNPGISLQLFGQDSTQPPLELIFSGRKKAHKHKLSALVNVQMALGQTAGCPRVNRAKKFMCSPRNAGNIDFSLWLTGGLSQGCPDFQKVYVFKVYVPFLALIFPGNLHTRFADGLD